MADLDFDQPGVLKWIRTTHEAWLAPLVTVNEGADGRPLRKLQTVPFATNPDAITLLMEQMKPSSPTGFIDGGSISYSDARGASGVRRTQDMAINYAVAFVQGRRQSPEDRLTWGYDAQGFAGDNLSDKKYRDANQAGLPAGWQMSHVKMRESFMVNTADALVVVSTWQMKLWSKGI